MVYAGTRCLYVHLFVCLSSSGIISKWLNVLLRLTNSIKFDVEKYMETMTTIS